MGCNCGKKKTPPTGASAKPSSGSTSQSATDRRIPGIKASGQRQTFTLETADGRTQSFGSRLEANAERIRRGGGTVKPA